MAAFDRFSIKVVAGVGLCGAAIALSPDAAAAPLKTGGYACMQGAAGEVAAPAVAGGAAACAPAGAPLAEMGGAAAAAPLRRSALPSRRVLRCLLALPFRQAPRYRLFLPVLH